jgi:hypothetical protein
MRWSEFPERLTRVPLAIWLLLLQLPLIVNPGYFSHDELEWLARADAPSWSALPWVSWLDFSPLQYRPLTFNLWLVLAHACASAPQLMHFAFVAIGTANAWLLASMLIAARIPERVAYAFAIVFSLLPYVVYVHGWNGTLADLLTLACGLLAARCLQHAISTPSSERATVHAAACTLLVAVALMCKESAVVLPALLPLATYGQNPSRRLRLAIAPAAAIIAVYLALRLPILADSAHFDSAYAWSLRYLPARLTEYLLYPFMPPLFEISPLLSKGMARIAAAAGCVLLLLGALASAGWRWPFAWLIAFSIALAPVLVLSISYDHYAYLASAVAIAICAAAWPKLKQIARTALLALAAIATLHGIIVMTRVYSVGVIQRNLYDDLLADLRRSPASLHIAVDDPRDAWLPSRLLLGVGTYRGVRIEGRVRFGAETPAQATDRLLWMNRDGHLHPDGSPLTPH